MSADASPRVEWSEDGVVRSARWQSERGAPPPRRVVIVDDTTKADDAYGLAAQGTGLLWRGDFHNARQLLTALASRVDRPSRKAARRGPEAKSVAMPGSPEMAAAFHLHRQARSQRARTLGMLLIEVAADGGIDLRRAPDVRAAWREARPDAASGGEASASFVVSLREIQGWIGAHEWRRTGIAIPAAGGSVHPYYGVFAPVRREYVDLVARAPLPAAASATRVGFDIGTGTGVLAAVLARRGIERVVATDQEPRALECARANVARLGLDARVEVVSANLFPPGRAAVVVCNPPWVPARPSSPLEYGIFDPDSAMLRGFLAGLAAHLVDGGEGWLVLSDLAEHLGLRPRASLLAWIEAAGLRVLDRLDARPVHPKVSEASDPLHAARVAEVTSLWRLERA